MLIRTDTKDGYEYGTRWFAGVTSCVSYLNSEFWKEDEWAGVSPTLLRMHQLEGEACHRVALEYLAWRAGLLDQVTPWPECPPGHLWPERWPGVLQNAMIGIRAWEERYNVVALAIEQSASSDKFGIAGTVDLKCEVTWRRRRVRAIVDLKFVAKLIMAHRLQVRIYRRLDGMEDCRMGFVVRIDRATGEHEAKPLLWGEEIHHEAAVLAVAQLKQWGRLYGKEIRQ